MIKMSMIASTDKDTRSVDMIAVGGAFAGTGRTTFADVKDTVVERSFDGAPIGEDECSVM